MYKAGHNSPALKAFMAKYSANKVPIKKYGARAHDGERYKPETGRRIETNYYYV